MEAPLYRAMLYQNEYGLAEYKEQLYNKQM